MYMIFTEYHEAVLSNLSVVCLIELYDITLSNTLKKLFKNYPVYSRCSLVSSIHVLLIYVKTDSNGTSHIEKPLPIIVIIFLRLIKFQTSKKGNR